MPRRGYGFFCVSSGYVAGEGDASIKAYRIQKLPRYVGIFMDYHYSPREPVRDLIMNVKPNSVIVTTENVEVEDWIRKHVFLRDDLYLKIFESDAWEKKVSSGGQADRVRDYLFLAYLKKQKGTLVIFPRKFETPAYGSVYSKRVRDLIIAAHQLNVAYEVIPEGAV